MNFKSFFTKNWIHFAILGIFLIITFAYFSPQFNGFGLAQHDIEQFKGMSHEITYFREVTGEEPYWTNSMFGGMPATQISVLYNGNIFKATLTGFFALFSAPAGTFLLHLICFYLMAMMLRIRPLIALLGALAFAFSSYEMTILQAGHNSKAIAVALSPLVLGSFIYAYRKEWKLGVLLSGLAMAFELSANHFQVTYYLVILLFALGVFYLAKALKEKEIVKFLKTSVFVVLAYGCALMINFGNVKLTNDYAKYTIRGGNDVTIQPNGSPVIAESNGLDKDYITQWSYGVGESFNLVSPYVKGSHSAYLRNTSFAKFAEESDLPSSSIQQVLDLPVYWGEQPITSGPTYLGVLVVFLAFLGLVLLKKRIKWVLFGVAVLALMLSWGKNFMGLTEFFIENVPAYDKFRTVTIILVLVELCLPVIGILLLQQFWDERESLKDKRKPFLITSGAFIAFLLMVKVIGLGDGYTSTGDERMVDQYRNGIMQQLSEIDPSVLKAQYNVDVSDPKQLDEFINQQLEPIQGSIADLSTVRKAIFHSSMNRSILVAVFSFGFLMLFFYTAIPSPYIVIGLSVVLLVDLIPVDLNYLGTETNDRGDYIHWVPEPQREYPISPTVGDEELMRMELAEHPELQKVVDAGAKLGTKKADELGYVGSEKRRVIDSYRFAALNMATDYRVFEVDGGAWVSSRASYFHKSLGGYHGAKLRNIQNLFEFHIARSNNNVLNMLNVKYFIKGDAVTKNESALGNAWLVRSVREFATPNDEIQALGKKFMVKNSGGGILVVNGEQKSDAAVFGGEELKYVLPNGDSLDVPLSNGLSKGLKAVFVMDIKGQTNLVPEMTLEADTANSFAKLVSMVVTEDFAPADEAVMLKSEAAKLSNKKFTGDGTITLKSYAPNKLVYAVNVKGPQLAVFSEIYYADGWKAYVDGKEQEIVKADYGLRALELPNGTYTVEFKFELDSVKSSETLSWVGSILLLLATLGYVFMTWRKGRKNKETEVK